MKNYLTAAAKVTSTACVIWSAYLLTRSRTVTKPRDERHHTLTGNQMENRQVFPAPDHPPESFTYPSTTVGTTNWSLWNSTRSYLSHGWQWITQFAQQRRTVTTEQLLLSPAKLTFTTEEFNFYSSLLSDLAVQANVSPAIRSILSRGNRFRFLGSQNSPAKMLDSILTALTCFTKNDQFVALLLAHEEFPKLIGRLTELLVQSFPPQMGPQDYPSSPLKTSTTNHSNTPTIVTQLPTNDWPTSRIHSVSSPVPAPPPTSPSQTTDYHPEYPVHLSFARFLANLSRHPASRQLVGVPGLSMLLSLWIQSPSLHLLLLCQKIQHNLAVHVARTTNSDPASVESEEVLYFPDIYQLNMERVSDPDRSTSGPTAEYDCDIIFVHGMRGSVFFTWRQNDADLDGNDASSHTKCWPRDWLSLEFPRTRILAIDASLNPFIWDPICPVDKLERAMDTRAKRILPQLRAAGVGQRPIIWITHSAGGILVKELIRMSDPATNQCSPPTKETKATGSVSTSQLPTRQTVPSKLDNGHAFDVPTNDAPSVSVTWFCDPEDQSASTPDLRLPSPREESCALPTIPTKSSDQTAEDSITPTGSSSNLNPATGDKLTCQSDDYGLKKFTQGIVFMSAPHRGNRSLYGLYRRPIRWTLTPEAIQLERDSAFLLDLHSWFHTWATQSQVKVLSMVETQVTPINRFWSVLLVPEDEKDSEMGEVVYMDSDHMCISKPRNQADPSYQHIVKFVREVLDGQLSSETEPQAVGNNA